MTVKVARLLLCCVFLFAAGAYAHHSFAMFDMSKNVTFQGVVTEYNWENPHTHVLVKTKDGSVWDIEGGAVNIMVKQGWSKTTYKAGDPITVVAHPMKDGSKAASLFYVILPGGKRLYHDVARPNADGSAPAPPKE